MSPLEKFSAVFTAMGNAKQEFEDTGNTQGTMECPKCGGNLNWGIAPSNKHTRGKCETPDCLAWIE